jgi:hypothetical protein
MGFKSQPEAKQFFKKTFSQSGEAVLVSVDNGKISIYENTCELPPGPYKLFKRRDYSADGAGYENVFVYELTTDRLEYVFEPSRTGIARPTTRSLRNVRDLSKLSLKDMGFDSRPIHVNDSQFVISSSNSELAIRSLKALNVIPVDKLERELKPNAASAVGFLGPEDSLIETLVSDNHLVVSELKSTHQELAAPLILIPRLLGHDGEYLFQLHGRTFKVVAEKYMGSQHSPFQDGASSMQDLTVTNLQNGKSLKYSEMLGDLIYRYGFYEGKGTPYRLDPRAIVEVFDFLKK